MAPILTERLTQLGQWLKINGDAIYGTSVWPIAQNDSLTDGVWYTHKPNERKIFVIILDKVFTKTEKQEIILGSVDSRTVPIISNIQLIQHEEITIIWKPRKIGISVELKNFWKGEYATTFVINLLKS